MIYVLDASAMLAFLRSEPGGEVVRDFLDDPDNRCYAHALNLCEVYYNVYRRNGAAAARPAIELLRTAGVLLRRDMEAAFWQQVGRLKATYSTAQHPLAIADCFAIALAQRVGGEFLTADHHEMDAIVPLGLCPIRFIR